MTFKPLLSGKAPEDLSKINYPVLASPKIDGIRCVKLGGKALSRTLKPIPNAHIREWVERHLPDGIDGELMLSDHTAAFQDVTSAIMSRDGHPNFAFHAFDLLHNETAHTDEFWQRYRMLEKFVKRLNGGPSGQALPPPKPILRLVHHVEVHNADELRAFYQRCLDEGYEGAMVRDPNAGYKFGRSTTKQGILLKVKPYFDEEATIVGVVEQMHNENELERDALGNAKRSSAKAGLVGKAMVGALECVFEDGTEFEVGAGIPDALRKEMWEACTKLSGTRSFIGRQVKVQHLGRLPSGKPRCPSFLGIRED